MKRHQWSREDERFVRICEVVAVVVLTAVAAVILWVV